MSAHALPRDKAPDAGGPGWRTPIAWALLVGWLGVTAWVFWWLELGGLRSLAEDAESRERLALFQADRLDPLALDHLGEAGASAAPGAVVVHFRDPSCQCNAEADAHFLSLIARHQGRGVVFAVADPPGTAASPARGLERLPRLPSAEVARLWRGLPALPVAAVFDAQGKPVYVGPYANATRCSTARGGPVEAALARAEQGRRETGTAGLALGCFCERRPVAVARLGPGSLPNPQTGENVTW
jgi:hypothetical protein